MRRIAIDEVRTMGVEVSVIVPVWNMESYLERCLDSLGCQDFESMEILLIDDGSTDASGEICRRYENRSGKFRYFRKENGGLSDARNYGIRKAAGKWIAFVDSDDYVEKNYVRELWQCAQNCRTGAACCGYYYEGCGTKQIKSPAFYGRIGIREFWQYILSHDEVDTSVCTKLFSAELFHDVLFPVGKKYEDIYTLYKLMDKVPAVGLADMPLYHYVRRNGSISQSYGAANSRDMIGAFREMLGYISRRYPELLGACRSFLYLEHIYNISSLSKAGFFSDESEWKKSRNYILKHWRLGQPVQKKKYRFSAWLIRLVPGLYSRALFCLAKGKEWAAYARLAGQRCDTGL